MDAFQAAQSIYESTFANLANKELLVDVDHALQIATFCAALAQAEQLKRIADLLERHIAPAPQVDPRQPGQSWPEYHQQEADLLQHLEDEKAAYYANERSEDGLNTLEEDEAEGRLDL